MLCLCLRCHIRREMDKKSHKRTRKKSDEEETVKKSKEHDATNKYRSVKRKQDIRRDKCPAEHEKKAFPVVKEVSHGSHQTKKQKTLYKLKDPKEVKSSHTVSFSAQRGNDSVKDKYLVSGTKTVQRESSKSFIKSSVSQRTQEASQHGCNEKSHQVAPSKVKSLLLSEREQKIQKISAKARKLSRNEKKCDAKTKELSRTKSICKKLLLQEKEKLLLKDLSRKRQSSGSETYSGSFLSKDKTSRTKGFSNATKNASDIKLPQKSTAGELKQPVWSVEATPLPSFKIPKRVHQAQAENTGKSSNSVSTNRNCKLATEGSQSETVHPSRLCHSGSQILSDGTRNERSSSSHLPDTSTTVSNTWHDEMQVVEELHLARSKKCLEVNVTHSYGELTCMDIDLTEDGATNTHYRQPSQQDLILVLDTNVLLSHLDYVKSIRSYGLAEMEFPVILIPWVVLQELDFLKRGKDLSGSVAHLAIPAISYIYNTLKNREPRLWGQSMQQASKSSLGLNAENNDDRVLQCCLQYQSLYPECTLILCTNDKNLCSKALLCGVKAFSKKDLESEVKSLKHGNLPLQSFKTSTSPHSSHQALLPLFENKPLRKSEVEEKIKWDVSRQVCELEDCLRDVLSDVLEVEMKAAYDDLWLEVVYRKPPWTLQDVLQCLKKHWIAVFGQVVQRKKLQLVLNLIHFFHSRKTVDYSATSVAFQEAKELVKAFETRSSHVPHALSTLDSIFNKLQPQSHSPSSDVVMNDDTVEDSQPTTTGVSHQEVWALFEKIWSSMIEASTNVFKALGFDPHTMKRSQPAGGPSPPQDAVVFLYKLSTTISQLLQAFSSVLSSAPGSEEVQMLLAVIERNEIVVVDSRVTAKDFCDCFSQQEYRTCLNRYELCLSSDMSSIFILLDLLTYAQQSCQENHVNNPIINVLFGLTAISGRV